LARSIGTTDNERTPCAPWMRTPSISAVADGPVWKAVLLVELGPAIGMVKIGDDVGGIEQDDQVLCQIGDGVDAEIRITEEHRARLGDGKGCADDAEIDIGQLLCCLDLADIAIAGNLRDDRTYDLGRCNLLWDKRQGIARGRWIDEHATHALEVLFERSERRGCRVVIEQRNERVLSRLAPFATRRAAWIF